MRQDAQFCLHSCGGFVRVVIDSGGPRRIASASLSDHLPKLITSLSLTARLRRSCETMAKKSRVKASKPGPTTKLIHRQIRIDHVVATAQPAPLANIFGVQNDGVEFRLLFFQARPPFINPTDPDAEKRFQALDSVPAICVADVAMAASRIPEVIRILSENFRHFEERKAALESGQ